MGHVIATQTQLTEIRVYINIIIVLKPREIQTQLNKCVSSEGIIET